MKPCLKLSVFLLQFFGAVCCTVDQKERTNDLTGKVNKKQHNHATAHCKEHTRQSPVKLKAQPTVKNYAVKFSYQPSHEWVLNLGHTVELKYDQGSSVSFENKKYELIQFHFHTPSEHIIQQKHLPMEVHLVHLAKDSTYLVVAILFKEGKENSFIKKFTSDIPQTKDGQKQVKNKFLNINDLLPKSKRFYTYSGSLTTPPYTEGVRWLLFDEMTACSKEQIQTMKGYEGFNARDLQKLNHRNVELFTSR